MLHQLKDEVKKCLALDQACRDPVVQWQSTKPNTDVTEVQWEPNTANVTTVERISTGMWRPGDTADVTQDWAIGQLNEEAGQNVTLTVEKTHPTSSPLPEKVQWEPDTANVTFHGVLLESMDRIYKVDTHFIDVFTNGGLLHSDGEIPMVEIQAGPATPNFQASLADLLDSWDSLFSTQLVTISRVGSIVEAKVSEEEVELLSQVNAKNVSGHLSVFNFMRDGDAFCDVIVVTKNKIKIEQDEHIQMSIYVITVQAAKLPVPISHSSSK